GGAGGSGGPDQARAASSVSGPLTTTSAAPGSGDATSATTPTDAQASSHTAVCQCAGSSSATRSPGSADSSSWRRLAVLATQLAKVATDNSTRSPVASS